MKKLSYILLFILFLVHGAKSQNIIVVDQAGGGQYITINSALTAAVAGDTIKVMPGLYYETINVTKKINIYGIDTTAVISGPAGNSFVFSSSAEEGSLTGMKVSIPLVINANNFVVAGNVFTGSNISAGSGVLKLNFTNNAIYSGSMSFAMGTGSVVVNDNKFHSINLTISASTGKSYLTANNFNNSTISATASGTAKIIINDNNFFANNTTTNHLTLNSSPPSSKVYLVSNHISGGNTGIISGNSNIIGNIVTNTNTAVSMVNPGSFEINLIANDIYNNGTGIVAGLYGSSQTTYIRTINLYNNKVRNNTGIGMNLYGHANFNHAPTVYRGIIRNNVFYGNTSHGIILQHGNNSVGYISGSSTMILTNNIVSNNTGTGISASTSFTVQDYNCLFGNGNNIVSGVGNISSDPEFLDPLTGNFNLQSNSACKDAGSPIVSDFDLDKTRNDMGIYGGSFNWNNFNSTNSSRVVELFLTPQSISQGSTITITGSGVGNKTQNTQNKNLIIENDNR